MHFYHIWITFQNAKQLEIIRCLQYGKTTKKYHPMLRLFCLTLHFYSPKAYDYLRNTFADHLPAARTIRAWYSSIDGSPGLTEDTFESLQKLSEKQKSEKGEELLVSLIFDEISIRQQSVWDPVSKQFLGHAIDEAPKSGFDFCPLSKEVLLFMISGINSEFRTPIGYFLTTGMNGHEKAALLNGIMKRLEECNIKLCSITFDGAPENISAMKILGADYENDRPYFENPYDKNSNVFALLDAPHMLKLIRNCLHRKEIIYDLNNDKIMWKYIENLVWLQISKNINLGNKLNKTHVDFKGRKMNVRVAAETISYSTSLGIEFLNKIKKHPGFEGSESTVEAIRIFNNSFDVMNSKRNHTKDQYKRPISEVNIDELSQYFNFFRKYIKGLKVLEDGKMKVLLQTKSQTPFFGFYHNTISFLGIYNQHLKPRKIKEFYTFDVSQDHVESFFGCIRRMNGCNDNPNAVQFSAAYRKLLVQNEVQCSILSNCGNDLTPILEVSSRVLKKPPLSISNSTLSDDLDFHEENDEDDGTWTTIRAPIETAQQLEKDLNDSSNAYLASLVEKRILNGYKQKKTQACLQCMMVFAENESINDDLIEFLSKDKVVSKPCKSTLQILRVVNKFLQKHRSNETSITESIAYLINEMDLVLLFPASDFGENHNHKSEFVKDIINEYLNIKSTSAAKLMTRMSQKKLLRHTNLKMVHREGQ